MPEEGVPKGVSVKDVLLGAFKRRTTPGLPAEIAKTGIRSVPAPIDLPSDQERADLGRADADKAAKKAAKSQIRQLNAQLRGLNRKSPDYEAQKAAIIDQISALGG